VLNGSIQEWWYAKEKLKDGKTMACKTVDLVPAPFGHAVLRDNVFTSPNCAKTTLTKANIDAAKNGDERKLEAVKQQFAKALSKPQVEEPSKIVSWQYLDDGECKYLSLYSTPLSHATEEVWGTPCK
jgi:hypothetical protein